MISEILKIKKEKLATSEDNQCWYVVKQSYDVPTLCICIEMLKEYQDEPKSGRSLDDFFKAKEQEFQEKYKIDSKLHHRTLQAAAYYGLLKNTSSSKANAKITDVFFTIRDRCNNNFLKKELYQDIIDNQTEKIYLSSNLDEKVDSTRRNYRLYPTMLLYKILLELGKATGKYEISTDEYLYLVCTTERYQDFLNTLLLIESARLSDNWQNEFIEYKDKLESRFNIILKQLSCLDVSNKLISLKDNYIRDVAKKIFVFENNISKFDMNEVNYINFLCSTRTLFDIDENPKIDRYTPSTTSEKDTLTVGRNVLLYGVPGVGKSFYIKERFCSDSTKIERVVFHPDYMNTDFIGQIMPQINKNEKIIYDFVPGPFTRVLKRAIEDPSNEYFLIIEELNRGNAAAIFGDIFQLLDRDLLTKTSETPINNQFIAKYVFDNPTVQIYIPGNLTILATMNTADQNVFTLDTAFQRRWEMKLIKNNIENAVHANDKVIDTSISWKKFVSTINTIILECNSAYKSEDKQLGAYFINKSHLLADNSEILQENATKFAEKVLKYLWDDAFKMNRNNIFNPTINSLEKLIDQWCQNEGDKRLNIFNDDIKSQLLD